VADYMPILGPQLIAGLLSKHHPASKIGIAVGPQLVSQDCDVSHCIAYLGDRNVTCADRAIGNSI